MTHNPHTHAAPDTAEASIDRVLQALSTSDPTAGLEARIHQRIAHARRADSRQPNKLGSTGIFAAVRGAATPFRASTSPFLYAFAAASLVAIAAISVLALHQLHSALPAAIPSLAQSQVARTTAASPESASPQSGTTNRLNRSPLAAKTLSQNSDDAKLALATAFDHATKQTNFQKVNGSAVTSTDNDPDAIALAETLAPSRPAPPMPLTEQERLLLSVTRRGQPTEIAELDIAHASSLRAAAGAREAAREQRFARQLLAPVALAARLESTSTQPEDGSLPAVKLPVLFSN